MAHARWSMVACVLVVGSVGCIGAGDEEDPPVAAHVAALVNGSACTLPTQCDSNICEDGICCAVACGLCSSCEATGTTCSVVPADDLACGTIDCDTMDGPCRDFTDLTANRCEAAGDCKDPNTADCTVYSDSAAGAPCGNANTGFIDGFESGTAGWVLQTPWGLSTTHATGTYSLTDSPSGSYANGANTAARMANPVSLVGITAPTLQFNHRYQVESGFDQCRVEISINGGTSWSQITSFSGTSTNFSSGAWLPVTISLASYAGQPSVLIRFRLTADSSIVGDGWFVDDVNLAGSAPLLCRACDGAGSCSGGYLTDDARCGTIDCDGLDTVCGNFSDLTTDRCEGVDGCKDANTADCTIFTNAAPGTDCGTCGSCNASGLCVADLTQNADCGVCRQCSGVGSCTPQPSGMDIKDECTPGICATGTCNGSGACGAFPSGTDCGACASCNSAGSCVVDLSQDVDCPRCQECTGIGTCALQGFGYDAKNECPAGLCVTGACDGAGSCGLLANGTACDPDLCSMGATCTSGVCSPPTGMVTCPAPSPCYEPGECNPSTGVCGDSPGPRPDGVVCDDGRGCTLGDRCVAGMCTPLANNCSCSGDGDCAALDACHLPGTCNQATHLCEYANAPDDTPCSDGNACTLGETCHGGECGAPSSTVTCTASDSCHLPGTCDRETGLCSNPQKANGTTCDDGRACTTGDYCEAGDCIPAATDCPCSGNFDCFALNQCHTVGTCDLATSRCSTPAKADDTACDDGDACTTGESCQSGLCGTPDVTTTCSARDECHLAGECSAESGICSDPRAPDGTACSIGTCQTGVCLPVAVDAGTRDARLDGGPSLGGDGGGCGCRAGGRGGDGGALAALLIAFAIAGWLRRGASRRS